MHFLQVHRRHFIVPVLTVLAFQVDIFGLGAATQAQSDNTILRLTAPWYSAREQKSVVAVLIDKPYVELPSKGSGGSPIPYRKFTEVIDQVLASDPAAIYISALFELRTSNDTAELRRLLQIIKEAADRGIPVLLPMRTLTKKKAPGDGDSTCDLLDGPASIMFDEKSVLPEVWELVNQSNGGIRFVAANWHGCQTHYPLMLDAEGKVPSAALLLARAARGCESSKDCPPSGDSPKPMLIRWSAFPTPERFAFRSRCQQIQNPTSRQRWVLVWHDIRNALMQSRQSEAARGGLLRCHYIDEVHSSNLMNHQERSADFIRGRIVLIGAAISMTQNLLPTPINGVVPDVIVDAAATENLMSLGERYTRDMDDLGELLLQLAVAVIVAAAALAIAARRTSTDSTVKSRVRWWALAICLALAFAVSMSSSLPGDWKTLLLIVPLAAAWPLHAGIATLTTLAFFPIGAAMVVIFLELGFAPINWVGALLAGLTALVSAKFH